MIPAIPLNFLTQEQALTDKTGKLSYMGIAFLRAIWQRTGSGNGVSASINTGLEATGSTSADALDLSADINVFATVAAGTGAKLYDCQPAQQQWIFNSGALTLTIYPPDGGSIDGGASYSLAAGKAQVFTCDATGTFLSLQLG